MNLQLDEQQCERRAEFRAYARTHVLPCADRYDALQRLPREAIDDLACQGYLGALVPTEYGGLGLDMVTFGLLNAELGSACSSLRSILTVHSMVCQAITRWGSRSIREEWLPRLADGTAIAGFALTEPDAGSDASAIESTACPNGREYVLDGHKRWITCGQIADVLLYFARTPTGISAFLVERSTPGLTAAAIDGLLGVRASLLADIRLDGCRVPSERRIGGEGFGLTAVASSALDLGRYSVACGCVGIAQASLDACVSYTAVREQYGVRLKDHQLIRKLLTEAMTNVRAAWLLCLQAGYEKDSGDPGSVVSTLMAKYFASRVAMKTAADAVRFTAQSGVSPATLSTASSVTQRSWRSSRAAHRFKR